MKLPIFYIMLLSFATVAQGAEKFSYTLSLGTTVKRINFDDKNPGNDMIAASIRYYYSEHVFFSGNATAWNNGIDGSKSSELYAITTGYRTTGKLFFETSLGIGYITNPDGKIVQIDNKRVESGYMTKQRQFEISFGGGYKITPTFAVRLGWTHFSNCQSICKLNDSYRPNLGRDFIRFGFEQRF